MTRFPQDQPMQSAVLERLTRSESDLQRWANLIWPGLYTAAMLLLAVLVNK